MQNAVVATPVDHFAKPEALDIYQALRQKYRSNGQPIKIWYFDPDFVIQFPTPQIRDMILADRNIEGINFKLRLTLWCNDYISQNNHVQNSTTIM